MRLSAAARVAVLVVALGVGSVVTPAKEANAVGSAASAAILAAMSALQVVQHAIEYAMQQWFTGEYFSYVQDSSKAVTEQVASNTVGVQTALQHHAAATIEAIAEQTAVEIEDRNTRTFGKLGSVYVGGRSMPIGSTAPGACRRYRDAQTLKSARTKIPNTVTAVRERAATHNKGYGSSTRALSAAGRDAADYGATVFSLDWIGQDVMDEGEFEKAERSIMYATNLAPLPEMATPKSAVGRQYKTESEQLRQLNALPQGVLARQLALRRGTEQTQQGARQSYLGVMTDWGKDAIEDRFDPVAAQATTEAGLLREISSTLKALLALETERMQSTHEGNAMLAVLTSRVLNERSQELSLQYAQAISAE